MSSIIKSKQNREENLSYMETCDERMECCSNDGRVVGVSVNAEDWSQTCTKCSKGKVMLISQSMSQPQRKTVASHLWPMHGACIIDLEDAAGGRGNARDDRRTGAGSSGTWLLLIPDRQKGRFWLRMGELLGLRGPIE